MNIEEKEYEYIFAKDSDGTYFEYSSKWFNKNTNEIVYVPDSLYTEFIKLNSKLNYAYKRL